MSTEPERKRSRSSSDDNEPKEINDLSPHWIANPGMRSKRILPMLPNFSRDQYAETDPTREGDTTEYLVERLYTRKWDTTHSLIYSSRDIQRFKDYSLAQCPTFGNCNNCLRAGPLGKRCLECPRETHYYCCIYTGINDRNLIDAQGLHNELLYEEDIERPNADRVFDWVAGRHPRFTLVGTHLLQVLIACEMQGALGRSPHATRIANIPEYQRKYAMDLAFF